MHDGGAKFFIGDGVILNEDLIQLREALVIDDDGEEVPHLREHADAASDRV